MVTKIVSENYFKYDQSDYAKSLRTIYGEDGYKKYTAKMNSIMTGEENLTNPIKASKEKYIFAKKLHINRLWQNWASPKIFGTITKQVIVQILQKQDKKITATV